MALVARRLRHSLGGRVVLDGIDVDIAVRLLPTGRELQLGVMTALLGAPFLGWLAIRRRANGAGGAPWLQHRLHLDPYCGL